MQAIYSDQFRFLSGSYGVKFETTALQPTIQAAVLPWREPNTTVPLLEKLPHTSRHRGAAAGIATAAA